MSITPSQIIEYLYCPRFTYFEYVLRIPQYEDKFCKVIKGREVHNTKTIRNKEYLRTKINVKEKYIDQYLTDENLRGKVDEVLLLEDETMAPLDYKFAIYEDIVYRTYKTQLFCYALLIEHNFKKKVNKGYLVYTRSANKLIEVEISEEDKTRVCKIIDEVLLIIENCKYPKATKYKNQCVECTYKNICIK
jgi:CRISPR-associated exonuclease Cas4